MVKEITPSQAIELAGSKMALARIFDPAPSRQAIQQWERDGAIPRSRLWELTQLRPEWFKKLASR